MSDPIHQSLLIRFFFHIGFRIVTTWRAIRPTDTVLDVNTTGDFITDDSWWFREPCAFEFCPTDQYLPRALWRSLPAIANLDAHRFPHINLCMPTFTADVIKHRNIATPPFLSPIRRERFFADVR